MLQIYVKPVNFFFNIYEKMLHNKNHSNPCYSFIYLFIFLFVISLRDRAINLELRGLVICQLFNLIQKTCFLLVKENVCLILIIFFLFKVKFHTFVSMLVP